MAEPSEQRRLAAILVADMFGYSRLMEADERGTIARQKAHRAELIDPKITKHHGQIVKTTGDGMLVEFASVVDAVECAVAIQRAMLEREADVPDDRRIRYRVGINLGDIVVEGDDIFGDGVNIAARLEEMAEPGGLRISGTAYDQLKRKLDVGYEFLGEQQVKNIVEPVRAYRVLIERDAARTVIGEQRRSPRHWQLSTLAATVLIVVVAGGVLWWFKPWAPELEPTSIERMAYPLPDKPSIAVLPFANLSGDPEQEYFAGGITNDIITDLAKFSTLFVIASNSSFRYKGKPVKVQEVARDLGVRYVLEGSVQITGDKLRINAQLIDATTGGHVWAEKYDREAADLFAVQKEVTGRIVGVIGASSVSEGALQKAELERISRTPTENLEAYDYFLRGRLHRDRETKEDTVIARRMFEKAVELDPGYARAMAEHSLAHSDEIWGDWTDSREQTLQQAKKLALRAIELDNTEPIGFHALGYVYQFEGRMDQAVGMWEKAYALNPNDFEVIFALGYGLAYTGQPEKGIPILEKAQLINPFHAESFMRALGQAYFLGRRYQETVATYEEVTRRHRTSFWLYLAASYAQLDRMEEARAAIAEALKLKPQLSLDYEIKRREKNGLSPVNAEHLREALRKAGLPE